MFRKVFAFALCALSTLGTAPHTAFAQESARVVLLDRGRAVRAPGFIAVFVRNKPVRIALDRDGRFSTALSSGTYQATVAVSGRFCRFILRLPQGGGSQTCSIRRAAAYAARSEGVMTLRLGRRTLVAIYKNGRVHVPLAAALEAQGVPIKLMSSQISFVGADGVVMRVVAYDNVVREGDEDVYHLSATPFVSGGVLYAALDDVRDLGLLDQAQASESSGGGFVAREIAAPHRAHAEDARDVAQRKRRVAPSNTGAHFSVRLTLLQRGDLSRDFGLSGEGANFHGTVGAMGNADLIDSTYGLVTVGTPQHNVAIGQPPDPLAGAFFSAQSTAGVELRNAVESYFDVARGQAGRFVGVDHRQGGFDEILAVPLSSPREPVLCVCRVAKSTGGSSDSEVWFSSRGLGVAWNRTTPGRLFADVQTALELGVLRMLPGDASSHAAVGYHLSTALTLRGGYFSAPGSPSSLYAGMGVAGRTESAAATISKEGVSGVLSAHLRDAYATFGYSRGRDGTQWQSDAGVATAAGTIGIEGYRSGASDVNMRWTLRGADAPVFGWEHGAQNGKAFGGPLYGMSFAIGRDLDMRIESHPTESGRSGRVSVEQRFFVRARGASPNLRVVTAGPVGMAAHVYVDGVQAGSLLVGQSLSVNSASPQSEVAVRTDDDAYSSLGVPAGNTESVRAVLYPVVTLSGRVREDDPDRLLQPRDLENLEIRLSRAGATAVTAGDGTFAFQAVPFAPDEAAEISPQTLPSDAIVERTRIDERGAIEIVIAPKNKVRKAVF